MPWAPHGAPGQSGGRRGRGRRGGKSGGRRGLAARSVGAGGRRGRSARKVGAGGSAPGYIRGLSHWEAPRMSAQKKGLVSINISFPVGPPGVNKIPPGPPWGKKIPLGPLG